MSREKTRLFCPGTSDLNGTGKGLKYGCEAETSTSLSHDDHHHHQHNSPFWAKAFFRSFCQLSLFLAAFLQFLSPNFLASSITQSSHLSFALSAPLSSSFYHCNENSSCRAQFLHMNNMSCPFKLFNFNVCYYITFLVQCI